MKAALAFILASQVILVSSQDIEYSCPEGWTQGTDNEDDTITDSVCVKIIDSPLPYDQANQKCQDLGGLLVTIKTARKQEMIHEMIKDTVFSEANIGLTDKTSDGVFKWSDGSDLDYNNWRPGSDSEAGREDCAALKRDTGKWRVHPCADFSIYFCEFQLDDRRICADFIEDNGCTNTFASDADMCSWEDYGSYLCRRACGLCPNKREGGPGECEIGQNPTNTILVKGNVGDVVVRGTVMELACENGFMQVGGHSKRGCLNDGTWGGSELVCKENRAVCETGWSYEGRTQTCLKYFGESKTFAQSNGACDAEGGTLVVIDNVDVADLVDTLAQGNKVAIGASRSGNNFDFFWAGSGKIIKGFEMWYRGEPNNWNGEEDCVEWDNGVWTDISCSNSRPYICQKSSQ